MMSLKTEHSDATGGPAQGRRIRPAFTLMYHDIERNGDNSDRGIGVTAANFEQQMRLLQLWGLQGVSIAEILSAQRHGSYKRLVGLTFDDAYRGVLEYAVPILHKYGFSATVFAITSYIGKDNQWDMPARRRQHLSARELVMAQQSGLEIGSHTLTHPMMSQLSETDLITQTRDSRAQLEEIVGPVRGFCYPYGDISELGVEAVKQAGYDYACAIRPGRLIGRFALPRRNANNRDGALRLLAKRGIHTANVPRTEGLQ